MLSDTFPMYGITMAAAGCLSSISLSLVLQVLTCFEIFLIIESGIHFVSKLE